MSQKTELWNILLIILLALLLASPTRLVSAGTNVWTSIGPYGGDINALAIDPLTPATLYAGTDTYGVFKSTDGGGHWNAANTGMPTPTDVSALAIDPSTPATLYAATWGTGVLKSTDGGEHWSEFNPGLTNPYVSTLAIDSAVPTNLYAGTNGGVFVIQQVQPVSFAKLSPSNSATGLVTNPTLSWSSSNGVTSYEYCYDNTNDNACSSWTGIDTNTSVA